MEEKTKASTHTRGDATRDALLDAATLVFAREGFGPANLREIAQAAGSNAALIGYHFGSKEGLYVAVFERMTGEIRQSLGPAIASIDQVLAEPDDLGPPEARRDRYLQPLLTLVEGMLTHMVREHPASGELILREQQAPGPAYEVLYKNVIQRHVRAMTGLLQKLRPGDDPEWIRLLVGSIASQVLSIRHYRASLMRSQQWDAFGDRELGLLKAMIRRNTTLLALGD
jgi:AcrR family transcriptional regulator